MAYFSLSVFACDFCNIERDIKKCEDSKADFLHFDVMDGHFVPMIGFGVEALKSVIKVSSLPIDVHLMTEKLNVILPEFLKLPVSSVLFHVENESEANITRFLKTIKENNVRAGLVISPHTNIEVLSNHLPFLDEILIMSAIPGTFGSTFIDDTFNRIKNVKKMVSSYSNIIISVDGAIDEHKAENCVLNGAKKIIMGRAFFKNDDSYELVRKIHQY